MLARVRHVALAVDTVDVVAVLTQVTKEVVRDEAVRPGDQGSHQYSSASR